MLQPNDLESVQDELRRLKMQNKILNEERMSLKVAADKYEKRAVYVRKKYQSLVEKTSNNSENSS
jgi:hypothetical protein